MKQSVKKQALPVLLCILCIGLNLVLVELVSRTSLPLYLDVVGTIIASALGGNIPGLLVAILTNLLKGLQNISNIYYGVFHVVIAILSVLFFRSKKEKTFLDYALFVLELALIGGVFGGLIYWFIEGYVSEGSFAILSNFFFNTLHFSHFWAEYLSMILWDILDKAVSVAIAVLVLSFFPREKRTIFHFNIWKQAPLTREEQKKATATPIKRFSLRTKLIWAVVISMIIVGLSLSASALALFRTYTIEQHTAIAKGAAEMAALSISPDMVDEYLVTGEETPGYRATEQLLENIRSSSKDIEYIYVYQIREDGCHVVFDLDTEEIEGGSPGDLIPFDESFAPYLPSLLAGEPIDPLITNDTYGWLLTVYEPIYTAEGECVAYAAADMQMKDLRIYEISFVVKLFCLFLGFLIFVIYLGLWLTKYHILFPINTMAAAANAFAYDSLHAQEENLKDIKALQINTGDEVEHLYDAVVKTTSDSVRFLTELERKNEMFAELQSGLIIVLADMVENRDEGTGDHIRKTADYTWIIMHAMKEKGYYADQLTDEFMEDVFRSAPLHDIGKIKIPDAILNKPGKLTDDEFEVMKSHTIAGEEVIDQVMETMPESSYFKEARNMSGSHHEKWNGRGYPRGLAGEEIPLSARIMAVADVFDALVSRRVYKPPFSFEKAMEIIQSDAGSHFDPLVADAFLSARDEVRKVAERFAEERDEVAVADELAKKYD